MITVDKFLYPIMFDTLKSDAQVLRYLFYINDLCKVFSDSTKIKSL